MYDAHVNVLLPQGNQEYKEEGENIISTRPFARHQSVWRRGEEGYE